MVAQVVLQQLVMRLRDRQPAGKHRPELADISLARAGTQQLIRQGISTREAVDLQTLLQDGELAIERRAGAGPDFDRADFGKGGRPAEDLLIECRDSGFLRGQRWVGRGASKDRSALNLLACFARTLGRYDL